MSFKKTILYFLFGCIALQSFAQKTYTTKKINTPITIDGILNEEIWADAEIATDFLQSNPKTGEPSSKKTEVKLLYDDDALYIGAVCYDNPNDISKVLCQRDEFNSTTDYFSILLDTYSDKQNGFIFSVSSMGVQKDAKIYTSDENSKLDMVWYSHVEIIENAWVVEIKIPYSAFRFAKKEEQVWGLNFTRYISKSREESSWNFIRPDLDNRVVQSGILNGIKNISPPLRLFFLPYVSGYAQHYNSSWNYNLNGGMDIKYGINEAFTLDMTLIPDFGQVVSDNVVLNLSPFEVQYNENRPFFTEGTELFEKAGLFYSRRVGGTPINKNNVYYDLDTNEVVTENPSTTRLVNATKVSGRLKSGLGVGIFNAISAPQYATIKNKLTNTERNFETSPLTNYNVIVLDQNLKNNSYVTLTNTNVTRAGETYDANVTGLNTKLNTKNNAYYVSGNIAVSQKYFNETILGHTLGASAGKQTGNFVFSVDYSQLSNTYNPNDLGFLSNNNTQSLNGGLGYNVYKPFWILNRLWSSAGVSYNRLYAPNYYTGAYYSGSVGGFTKKFFAAGVNFEGSFTPTYDYFEPRRNGYVFILPSYYSPNVWISSNYQKIFAIDARITYGSTPTDWKEFGYQFSPRVRITNNITIIYNLNQEYKFNQKGYAIPFSGVPETNDVIIGKRDVKITTNTLDVNYTLTNKMGITFRLRHYWTALKYTEYFTLQPNGEQTRSNITGLNTDGTSIYNNNFNAFTIDMIYRWVFSPASQLNIAWKNNIFTSNSDVGINYINNLNGTINANQLNSISVKLIYFLEYQMVKRRFRK